MTERIGRMTQAPSFTCPVCNVFLIGEPAIAAHTHDAAKELTAIYLEHDPGDPALLVAGCPSCGTYEVLSDEREAGLIFDEAICQPCRDRAIYESRMTDFDISYEKARANGWED